jgi:hypothetical protein
MDAANLLGIKGLTVGGAGIWVLVLLVVIGGTGRIINKWVTGMADRKRAANEGVTVEVAANEALMNRMLAEMARMGTRIEKLEARVGELEADKRGLTAERDAALAENARLRAVNQGQGEVNQRVAQLVAIERLEDRAAGAAS